MVGKDLWELYLKNKNGCDHKCQSCELFSTKRNECYYEEEKKWEQWVKQQHIKFGEILDNYGG